MPRVCWRRSLVAFPRQSCRHRHQYPQLGLLQLRVPQVIRFGIAVVHGDRISATSSCRASGSSATSFAQQTSSSAEYSIGDATATKRPGPSRTVSRGAELEFESRSVIVRGEFSVELGDEGEDDFHSEVPAVIDVESIGKTRPVIFHGEDDARGHGACFATHC